MRFATSAGLLFLSVVVLGCGGGAPDEKGAGGSQKDPVRLAFITNGVADFWTVAEAGARAGASEFGARVDVLMPAGGIGEQKAMVEDSLTKAVAGIAISPIDPPNQQDLLRKAAQDTLLITHDSDAPGSDRLAYVGMDNYEAGWLAGEMARAALPEGGSAAIFIGRLEQDNARRRRQGVLDAFLGRTKDPARFDSPESSPESTDGKYRLVGTYTDQFDFSRAKANVEDCLTRFPDLGCAVGLFGYNPPLILEALKGAEALGQVKVVAFDEDAATLEGIRAGTVEGTVVQNPFEYGRQSVRLLAGLARGQSLAQLEVPGDGVVLIPARVISASNLEEFEAVLAKNLGR